MKAILIDDEKPALQHLERLLAADGRIHVSAAFTTVKEGLEYMRQAADRPAVVFLDIGMPEMNGLEAAACILTIDSAVSIVYVTAYAEYAVEAFEVHALDYLLKPVQPSRLFKSIDRIVAEAQRTPVRQAADQALEEPVIQCFKRLVVYREGDNVRLPVKWRTAKARELFALLLHHKGSWMDKDYLLETLWPEQDPEKAMTYLHTSVSQSRKLIRDGFPGSSLDFSLGSYRLNLDSRQTDVDEFLQLASLVKSVNSEQERGACERMIALYKGDYLEEHDYGWAKPKRDQLVQLYTQAVIATAKYETHTGRARLALSRLLPLQQKEPYSDELCRAMMEAYAYLGDSHALRQHYEEFSALLASELGVRPHERTETCYQQLRASLGQQEGQA
ncbi:response regulator [Xylanibacillus composti]|uniref:Response regulatory domain-containing protein n=1 Tax=Xylanibacillus composti TaxID=1572762 RepID=A0A8J4M1N1_9BACL|nr:response regulator [Xylanibacillus composti]MDT9726075.1 response regulator [Xylanibacillus composti]GIQ68779.1 hypothetical protein XYCOK13_16030 [Xylanibacillus composti]